MRAEALFARVSAVGAAAQASVPALYAWGVTVAPFAWARSAPLVAKIAAAAALLGLAAGMAAERRWGQSARAASLWAFVGASAVVWSVSPAGVGSLRFDAPRGIAGMLGWALFALASAAPALRGTSAEEALGAGFDASPPLPPGPPALPARPERVRSSWVYVAAGGAGAALLQSLGWRTTGVERALLVRLVALAAGLALIGAATQAALARHLPRPQARWSRRLRRATLPLAALALLAASGVLFALRD